MCAWSQDVKGLLAHKAIDYESHSDKDQGTSDETQNEKDEKAASRWIAKVTLEIWTLFR